MLRMRSRNSAGSSSRALRTSRAKRARRRSDIALPFWGPGGGALRLLSGHARQAHPTQGPRPNAADARLGEAYLTADLAQREPAAVRQDEHAPLERGQLTERSRYAGPALVAWRWPVLTMLVGKVAHALERDLDVGWGKILRDPLRAAELPARGARQRGALAERVQGPAPYPARRVWAGRRAAIAAVPPRGLHEADDTPRDEVLAVVPAAARVERARRDGPRERKVRDDALVARRLRHASPPAADPR